MNNIGFGIFCFGEEFYFKGTIHKINEILKEGYHCYVLTDEPEYFEERYSNEFVHTILYTREYKSYHDKMILPKHILKIHDFCVLIDADVHIKDFSFLKTLKEYKFGYGISYVDTLLNHPGKKETAKDIVTDQIEWGQYKLYVEKTYPSYGDLETIWEYFLVINKVGFNQRFYNFYDRLQLAKDFSDLTCNKMVSGAGEGISLAIASKLSNTDLQRDMVLFDEIKNNFESVSRRFMRPEFWPEWMK